MCGFVAIYHKDTGRRVEPKQDDVRNLLYHRGPDEFKVYSSHDGRLDLFFYRLAIIDLEFGSQPMLSHDGKIVSVFNGEIYNYKELREELSRHDVTLKTHGDAEVIPNLYAVYGSDFVKKLRGMFSIVLWDGEELHVYRDRYGIKPLYQAEDSDKIIFSSEIKPVLKLSGQQKSISQEALADYLRYGYVIGPHNIYEQVKTIAPATHLCLGEKKDHQELFYDVTPSLGVIDDEEKALGFLEQKMTEAVDLHLQSDVPVGIFLSGGLDSGMIAALAAKNNKEVKALTLKFVEAPVDESTVAADIAHHCGLSHDVISVTSKELLDVLKESIWRMETPLADSGALANFVIAKEAKKRGLKVVLCGAGGDEIFAGYTYHVKSKLEKRLSPYHSLVRAIAPLLKNDIKRKLKRSLSFDCDPLFHYLDKTRVFHDLERFADNLNSHKDLKETWFTGNDYSHKMKRLYGDLHTYVPDNLMLLIDRATMASSLEGRVPFLDHELVDLAFSFSDEIRTPRGERKGLLKKLATRYLPASVFDLPKLGFNSPVQQWMEGPLGERTERLLHSELFLGRSFWQRAYIEKVVDSPLNFHQKWTLLQLELFCRVHLDGNYSSIEEIDWDQLW